MHSIVHTGANQQARAMLHRFLEHRRSELAIDAAQRILPSQFFPVDVRVLIQLAGWKVEQVSMVGHTSTYEPVAARCSKPEKTITLLSTLPDEVKRYTLAHELGHALLHAEIPDCNGGSLPRVMSMLSASSRGRGNDFGPLEREAEIFARELLMPEKAVRHHFRQLFRVDKIDASSGFAAQFAQAPRDKGRGRSSFGVENARKQRKEVAEALATWRGSPDACLAEFFGVSRAAMASRLIGFQLVF